MRAAEHLGHPAGILVEKAILFFAIGPRNIGSENIHPMKAGHIHRVYQQRKVGREATATITADDGIKEHQGGIALFPRRDRTEKPALLVAEIHKLIGIGNRNVQGRHVEFGDELHHVAIPLDMLREVIVEQVVTTRFDAPLVAPLCDLSGKAVGQEFCHGLAVVNARPTGGHILTFKETGEDLKEIIAMHLFKERRQILVPGGTCVFFIALPGGLHQVGLVTIKTFYLLP